MAFKIKVEDRIATHPGRVMLTPVSGETNIYDMTRADMPIVEGTPIDARLFNSKAYTLNEDITVYVSTTGSDLDGDGSAEAPFLTIQAAINALPKHLGGHIVQIEIEDGTYEERVKIEGFTAGKLILGRYVSTITVRGIEVVNSSIVELQIRHFKRSSAFNGSLLKVTDGSSVIIGQGADFDGGSVSYNGIDCDHNSKISVGTSCELVISNVGNAAAISAMRGSEISLDRISGDNNLFGVYAQYGSVVRWKSGAITAGFGDGASEGSQLITGSGSSTLVNATVMD